MMMLGPEEQTWRDAVVADFKQQRAQINSLGRITILVAAGALLNTVAVLMVMWKVYLANS